MDLLPQKGSEDRILPFGTDDFFSGAFAVSFEVSAVVEMSAFLVF